MRRNAVFTLTFLAALLWVGSQVWAQGPGPTPGGGNQGGGNQGGGNQGGGNQGGGQQPPGNRGYGNYDKTESVDWARSLAAAIEAAKKDNKHVFVFTHPNEKAGEEPVWTVRDIVDASRTDFVFYWFKFEKDGPDAERLKVDRAPAILGLDRHGNVWRIEHAYSSIKIFPLLKAVPQLVRAFESRIARDLAAAKEALAKGDQTRALRILAPLAAEDKVGYPEIAEANKLLEQIASGRLRQLDELAAKDPASARKELDKASRDFKGTTTADLIEMRLARLDWAEENARSALARLRKLPHLKDAKSLEDEILKAGERRVENAMIIAALGVPARAKKILKEVEGVYRSTPVEKLARQALQQLN